MSQPTAKHPVRHKRHRIKAQPAVHHRPAASFPVSPVGDRDDLPVTGYPVTRFVLVLLAIGLAALAVRGGMVVYGRIRGPARGTG